MISTVNTDLLRIAFISLLALSSGVRALADIPVEYKASVTAQASSASLSPYMLGSWNEGRYAEGNGIWQEASVLKRLDKTR